MAGGYPKGTMLSPGDMLGRYRVDAFAARGGMAAVYRATDTVLERPVALKVVLPDQPGADMADRLAQESLQAAQLSHPNVLPVYDAGQERGVAYVAMQWVDGRSLEEMIAADGPLALERTVTLAEEIAGALDHAHDSGLVHRDVKPGNVMVDAAGHAYLMDFGLSMRTDRTSALTRTGEFLATVDYAAPEQIEAGAIDRRADVYGLGALVFRCLTGHVPFERDSTIARLYAHVNDPAPSPRALRADVPEAMALMVERAMAKAPDERPATAGAFAAGLRTGLDGPSPAATAELPVLAPAAQSRWGLRRTAAAAAAAVAAAVGGVALAGAAGGGGEVPTASAQGGASQSAGRTTTGERTAGGERDVAALAGAGTTAGATGSQAIAAPRAASHKDKDKQRKRHARHGRDEDRSSDDGAGSEDPFADDGSGSNSESDDAGPGRTTPSGQAATGESPSSAPAPATTPSDTTPTDPAPSSSGTSTSTSTAPSDGGGATTTSTQPSSTTTTSTTPTETQPTQTQPEGGASTTSTQAAP